MSITIGLDITQTFQVTEKHLISDIHESLPPALATYIIVKWAEITSGKLLLPHLDNTETSVGIRVDIKHSGVSTIQQTIKIHSKVTSVRGSLIVFQINVHDGFETIAAISHTRAIVNTDIIQAEIKKKQEK